MVGAGRGRGRRARGQTGRGGAGRGRGGWPSSRDTSGGRHRPLSSPADGTRRVIPSELRSERSCSTQRPTLGVTHVCLSEGQRRPCRGGAVQRSPRLVYKQGSEAGPGHRVGVGTGRRTATARPAAAAASHEPQKAATMPDPAGDRLLYIAHRRLAGSRRPRRILPSSLRHYRIIMLYFSMPRLLIAWLRCHEGYHATIWCVS